MNIWEIPWIRRKILLFARKIEEGAWGGEQLTLHASDGTPVRATVASPNVGLMQRPHLLTINNRHIEVAPYEARLLRYYAEAVAALGLSNEKVSDEALGAAFEVTIERMHRAYMPDEIVDAELRVMLQDMLNMILLIGTKPVSLTKIGVRPYDFVANAEIMRGPLRANLAVSPIARGKKRACNADCGACYVQGSPLMTIGNDERELTTAEWCKIIDKLWNCGTTTMVFTGGEASLRTDLVELVRHARKAVTMLNTNGLNMAAPIFDGGPTLAQALRKVDLDVVQFTWYSLISSVHNYLMGVGRAYDRTLEGIKAALAEGISVSINIPLCTINAPHIVDTLRFLDELGVKFVTVSGLIATGGAVEMIQQALELTHDELYTAVKAANEFASENGMRLDLNLPGQLTEEELHKLGMGVPYCDAATLQVTIGPKGDILACQSHVADGDTLGNILTDDPTKVWQSPRMKAIRAKAGVNTCMLRDRIKAEVK